jgi:hypothetical protein
MDSILYHLELGHVGKAIEEIHLSCYVDEGSFIDLIKKQGILRHSSYLQRKNPVVGIARHLLPYKADFDFDAHTVRYLESLINFEVFYNDLNQIDRFINSEVHKFKSTSYIKVGTQKVFLSKAKTLLALNDYWFLEPVSGDRSLKSYMNINFYSKENFSEAISLIIQRYNKFVGFTKSDLGLIDESYLASTQLYELILQACRYKAIRGMEMDIEVYGFVCAKRRYHDGSKDNYIVEHPDKRFTKSIELANIQFQLQTQTNAFHSLIDNSDATSITDVVIEYYKKFPDCFQLLKEPVERYVMSVHGGLFAYLLGFKQDQYYREEIDILATISRQLLIPIGMLSEYQIRGELTLHDFLKVSRFFTFMYFLFATKLSQQIEGEEVNLLVLRSILPVFKKE